MNLIMSDMQCLAELTNLQSLQLHGVTYLGDISRCMSTQSHEIGFGHLTQLTELDLRQQWPGPCHKFLLGDLDGLSHLSGLRTLTVLTSIPSCYSPSPIHLPPQTCLGVAAETLSKLQHLTALHISSAEPSITSLTNLQVLSVYSSSRQLTNALCDNLQLLTRLNLAVSYSDFLVSPLLGLPCLSHLALDWVLHKNWSYWPQTKSPKPLNAHLFKILAVTHLDLINAPIDDDLLVALAHMPHLARLYLGLTQDGNVALTNKASISPKWSRALSALPFGSYRKLDHVSQATKLRKFQFSQPIVGGEVDLEQLRYGVVLVAWDVG